jgi:hypothetical protein
MYMIEYKTISWWYWLITVVCLTGGVSGWPLGFGLAIGITLLQILHFILIEGKVTAFPIQVRVGYLLLLVVASPEPFQSIFWIPTIGTWAQVLFGYCTMARTVSLLPWNRKEPLSIELVKRTYFAAPVRGSIMQGFSHR